MSNQHTTTEINEQEPVANDKQVVQRKKAVAKKKYKFLNFVVILVLFGFLIWAIKTYFHLGDDNYTNAAQVEAFVNPVNTRVPGYVKAIYFDEHQAVKKGDTLLVIDDSEINTQLAQAEAAYMNALAAKQTTLSSLATVENNVGVASATIEGAKVRLWNAEQNFKRYQALLKEEAVTQQQYDQMRTEYEAHYLF